jgi:AbrB family looped-hinge helix DNA binding protein
MTAERAKIVEGGRIVIPAKFRRAMGIDKGDTVWLELHGDELRVRPARSALRRIQERLRPFAPQGRLISDELIADRRIEAAGE